MFPALLLAAAAAASACPEPVFEFVGQPECVQLAWEDGRTTVTNACSHEILVDQSVQLQAGSHIPAHRSAEIRDLSAFTVGMDGELYRVVAMVAECEATGARAEQ